MNKNIWICFNAMGNTSEVFKILTFGRPCSSRSAAQRPARSPLGSRSHKSQHETTRGSKLLGPTAHADNAELLGRQQWRKYVEHITNHPGNTGWHMFGVASCYVI